MDGKVKLQTEVVLRPAEFERLELAVIEAAEYGDEVEVKTVLAITVYGDTREEVRERINAVRNRLEELELV